MSWLNPTMDSRQDLLALHPGLAASHRTVEDEIWASGVDPHLLELCRVRTATLVGNRAVGAEPMSPAAAKAGLDADLVAALPQWPTDPRFTPAMRAALTLAEQFVLDVHGITDELVDEVAAHLGPDGVVTLTTALATWEITHRFDNALLGATEAPAPATDHPES
ncbi:MAG: carboxymuconolactone decarboxylase family protein [Actinomycetota bacterium]